MSEKDAAGFDQAMAAIAETQPPMLWRFYQNLLREGFSEPQAFTLTAKLLTSLFGIRPSD